MSDTNKEKVVYNVRISQKHDTEAKWNESPDFIPKAGEEIIYDPDEIYVYSRSKIGDGITRLADLPFYNPQGDMDQSDPNAADFIRNRTHYREWKTHNKLEHLSMPGEEAVGGMWYPIGKVYDLVIGETYTMTYEILDVSDNTIIQTGTEEIVATDIVSIMGEEACSEDCRDAVCIYSSELEYPVFVNGVYANIEAQRFEKSETNSYILSFTLLSDSEYSVRVVLEGPGFVTENWEYNKLPEEYLPIQELDLYEPEYYEEHLRFEYPNRCKVRNPTVTDYDYAFSPEIEGGYYVVTEVNEPVENYTYGDFCFEARYGVGGVIAERCILQDSSSVLPAVGDLIAFDYFIGGYSNDTQISNNPEGIVNYRIVDTDSFTYRFIPRPTDKTSCSIDIFTTITTPDQQVTDAEKKFANLYLVDGNSIDNLTTDNSKYGQNLVEKITCDNLYQGGHSGYYGTQYIRNPNNIEFYTNTQNVDATSWIANIHIDIDIVAKDRILVKETMYCGIGVSTDNSTITSHPNPAVEHRAWSVVPWKGNKYASELDFFDEFKYIFFSFEDTYIRDIKVTWR